MLVDVSRNGEQNENQLGEVRLTGQLNACVCCEVNFISMEDAALFPFCVLFLPVFFHSFHCGQNALLTKATRSTLGRGVAVSEQSLKPQEITRILAYSRLWKY